MIVPDLEELLALRGEAHGLRLISRRGVRALHSGAHRSTQRGRGLEFQEVRPYVSGDDPRTIDWRVTARRGRPHTKLFREERERPVWLLVDLGASMFFGSRRQLKSSVAIRAAALLAWIAAVGGDRVGAVLVGMGGVRILPPRAREAGVLPVLSGLLELRPVGAGEATLAATARLRSAPAGFSAALVTVAPLVHPGSLVLALSDFATGLDSAEAAARWAALAVHNDVRLFWITDPLESQGLPDGRFRLGLFGRRSIAVDGASTRAAWTAKWREREAQIDDLARRISAPIIQLDTSDPVESVLRTALAGRTAA